MSYILDALQKSSAEGNPIISLLGSDARHRKHRLIGSMIVVALLANAVVFAWLFWPERVTPQQTTQPTAATPEAGQTKVKKEVSSQSRPQNLPHPTDRPEPPPATALAKNPPGPARRITWIAKDNYPGRSTNTGTQCVSRHRILYPHLCGGSRAQGNRRQWATTDTRGFDQGPEVDRDHPGGSHIPLSGIPDNNFRVGDVGRKPLANPVNHVEDVPGVCAVENSVTRKPGLFMNIGSGAS